MHEGAYRSKMDLRSVRIEVRRFSHLEHDRGDTNGWQFEVGWFRRMSGLEWAWFSREVAEWKW